jgi:acetyl-CoA carboxylase biotin carboxyl carrier protein
MTKRPAANSAPKSTAARSAPREIDASLVREIAEMLSDTDLTEIEVEKGDLRIRVAREIHYATAPASPPPIALAVAAAPGRPAIAPAPTESTSPADHPGALKSPMVGTAYRRPSPEASAFVEIGSVVKPGDKIFLIEAMKTFNEITANHGGTVTAIMVEDGQPVEYGQTLAIIE